MERINQPDLQHRVLASQRVHDGAVKTRIIMNDEMFGREFPEETLSPDRPGRMPSTRLLCRRSSIKWMMSVIDPKRMRNPRRVSLADVCQLGYRESGEDIGLLSQAGKCSRMVFMGLLDPAGDPAHFCFLHLARGGMGVIVHAPISTVGKMLTRAVIEGRPGELSPSQPLPRETKLRTVAEMLRDRLAFCSSEKLVEIRPFDLRELGYHFAGRRALLHEDLCLMEPLHEGTRNPASFCVLYRKSMGMCLLITRTFDAVLDAIESE